MERRTGMGERRSTARGFLFVLAGSMGVALAIGTGAVTRGQEPAPGSARATGEIRDHAGLFGADAIASARGELERVARDSGASIIIETVDTIGDEPIDRAAVGHARRSGIRGLYLLIARKERKLEVLASGRYRELLSDTRRREIIDAFSDGFHRRDFNEGLKHGVAEIARLLATARRPGPAPPAPVPSAPSGGTTGALALSFGPRSAADSPLVARNQVRLTLAGARSIIAGAAAKAQAMGLKSNIAVVDDGGHLIAFERMEGARPASIYTALTKATSAATFRQATGPLSSGSTGTGGPDVLLNLSVQNAAVAGGGKITTLYGGVPVVVDGQVIGGVGVGGGTGEQDAQVARAGIQALSDQLARPAAEAKESPRAPEDVHPKAPTEGTAEKPSGSDF